MVKWMIRCPVREKGTPAGFEDADQSAAAANLLGRNFDSQFDSHGVEHRRTRAE